MGLVKRMLGIVLVASASLMFLPVGAGAQVTDPSCLPAQTSTSVLGNVIDVAAPVENPRAAPLPTTGASLLLPVTLGLLLVTVGALLMVVTRRRQSAAGPLVLLAVVGIAAGLTLGVGPASAQVDPCVTTPVPAPIIPESPLALLLPLSGLAVATGAVLARSYLTRETPTSA